MLASSWPHVGDKEHKNEARANKLKDVEKTLIPIWFFIYGVEKHDFYIVFTSDVEKGIIFYIVRYI